MAQETAALSFMQQTAAKEVKTRSYWATAWANLLQDKLTIFAFVLLVFMISITLAAPWIANNLLGYSPTKISLRERNKPPTWSQESWGEFQRFTDSCGRAQGCQWSLWPEIFRQSSSGIGQCLRMPIGNCHWMGTDDAGRDVLTRGIYGGRISLRIGVFVAVITLTIGVFMGLISGYYATTKIDDIISAIFLLIDSIPVLFLLILLSQVIEPGPEGLALLIGIFGWVGLSRVIRGKIFTMRERDFVLAGRAVGGSNWHIMFKHILPNIISIIIVFAVFEIAGAILAEASLSFLGVGIGPPNPSWGNMMQGSLGNFTKAPWLVITPGFFIFLTTLAIFLLGDGLRDALDPTLKHKK
jgi:peptide/nickel transport system permease protein